MVKLTHIKIWTCARHWHVHNQSFNNTPHSRFPQLFGTRKVSFLSISLAIINIRPSGASNNLQVQLKCRLLFPSGPFRGYPQGFYNVYHCGDILNDSKLVPAKAILNQLFPDVRHRRSLSQRIKSHPHESIQNIWCSLVEKYTATQKKVVHGFQWTLLFSSS